MSRVRDDVELVDGLDARVSDLETLYELSREEADVLERSARELSRVDALFHLYVAPQWRRAWSASRSGHGWAGRSVR